MDTRWKLLWAVGSNKITPSPVPVQAASGVSSIAAGSNHTLFIKSDSSLWGMGSNLYGQLGDGTTSERHLPISIASGVSSVAGSVGHTAFVKADGSLWTMGWNNKGQLGTGDTTNRKTPVQVATGVKYVTAGKYHTLFLKTDDSLWAMGTNEWKQLGGDDTTNRLLPVMIAADVAEVEAGDYHTMFVKNDRTLWMVGSNGYGQLGNGSRVPQSTPFMLANNVAAISAGEVYSMFTKQDGSLWATGSNAFGQLGDGTEDLRERPVKIVGPASSVSSLSGVILSAGNLSPAFSPGTLVYAVSVPNGTGTIKVTPMVTEPATIAVNGADVGSGAESGAIPLAVGNNMINVVVTAEDEVSNTSYQIVVRREAASSVSTLSKLAIAGATLSPKFNSANSAYTVKVPNATRSLKITPTATPFNDGVANLLKYAFNMNASGPDVSVLTPGGNAGLPQISVDTSGAVPVLRVAFLRRKGSGLIYTPQRSNSLGSFVGMAGTQTVTAIDAQWERVSVEEPAPPSTAPRAFVRVQIALP